MLGGIAETMIEEDKADFESNLAASRSTEKLFKYYRNFKSTAITSSVSFKNEIANDPVRSDLFSHNILLQFSKFLPASCQTVRLRCYLYLQILTFPNKRLKRYAKI